MADISIP